MTAPDQLQTKLFIPGPSKWPQVQPLWSYVVFLPAVLRHPIGPSHCPKTRQKREKCVQSFLSGPLTKLSLTALN